MFNCLNIALCTGALLPWWYVSLANFFSSALQHKYTLLVLMFNLLLKSGNTDCLCIHFAGHHCSLPFQIGECYCPAHDTEATIMVVIEEDTGCSLCKEGLIVLNCHRSFLTVYRTQIHRAVSTGRAMFPRVSMF